MKKEPTSGRIIQIILGIYALLYIAYLVLPFLPAFEIYSYDSPAGKYKTFLTFVAFMLVYLLSWSNRDIAGMLLIVGYIASILMDALLENIRLEAVILGFPFDTLINEEERNQLMKHILNFFE